LVEGRIIVELFEIEPESNSSADDPIISLEVTEGKWVPPAEVVVEG
jgi:hypothetical protein